MKKLFLGLLISMMLVMSVSLVTANKPSTSNFVWWQTYCGWGPALHYGEPVLVHYTSINTWTLKKKVADGGWDINQELTQDGSADVYKIGTAPCGYAWVTEPAGKGILIASGEQFHVVENTQGFVTTDKSWYHRTQVDVLKNWNYHWIISGVYHYFGSYHNGQWSSKILKP